MKRFNNSLLTNLVAISATATAETSNTSNRSISSSSKSITMTSPSIVRAGYTNGTNNNNVNQITITQDKSKNANEAAQVLKQSNVVCFDVDSTVIREEGIDELAKFCGKGEEVSKLTKEAMKGSMTFQDALMMRLNIIKPSQKEIRDFLQARPSTLSVGIKDLITHLKLKNIPVYLISGGFDCLIEPVALELGIPLNNLFANKLLFYFNGDYAGFDKSQPTSHSGGKGEAISFIRRTITTTDIKNVKITMIGDGATDLEAAPPADNFIGYGGNIVRDEVRNRSHYYITDFHQITESL